MMQLCLSGYNDEILSEIFNSGDVEKRHVNTFKKFEVQHTWKITEWVKNRISDELNISENIFENKPKPGSEVKIKGKEVVRD